MPRIRGARDGPARNGGGVGREAAGLPVAAAIGDPVEVEVEVDERRPDSRGRIRAASLSGFIGDEAGSRGTAGRGVGRDDGPCAGAGAGVSLVLPRAAGPGVGGVADGAAGTGAGAGKAMDGEDRIAGAMGAGGVGCLELELELEGVSRRGIGGVGDGRAIVGSE